MVFGAILMLLAGVAARVGDVQGGSRGRVGVWLGRGVRSRVFRAAADESR